MSSIRHSSSGFTAIELLIMLVVLAITFTAFSSTFITIQTLNKKAGDINTANQLAFAKVQDYQNRSFSSLPATSPQGSLQQVENFSSSLPTTLQSPRSGLVYINTVSPTLKEVVVNVTFNNSGSTRIIQYADFIQKNGL